MLDTRRALSDLLATYAATELLRDDFMPSDMQGRKSLIYSLLYGFMGRLEAV